MWDRRLIVGAATGALCCAGAVLAAPAATALGFGPAFSAPPPPPGEPVGGSDQAGFPPVRVLAAVDGRVEVAIGDQIATCVAVDGDLAASGGGLGAVVAGDATLRLVGVDPLDLVNLDEHLQFTALLQAPDAPGGRVTLRCARTDDGGPGPGNPPVRPPAGPALPAPAAPGPGPEDGAQTPGPGSGAERPQQAGGPAVPDASGGQASGAGRSYAEGAGAQADTPDPGITADAGTDDAAAPGGPAASSALPLAVVIAASAALGAAALGWAGFQYAVQKGSDWVRANVRAQPQLVPAPRVEFAESDQYQWPTAGVQFALHADGGRQNFREETR